MSTIRGVAVVTGTNGLTFTMSVDATGVVAGGPTQLLQNATYTRDADIKYVKDASGDSKAAFISDRKKTFKFEGVPYSTTVALARLETDKMALASGGTVLFTDTDLVSPDAVFGGKYLLLDGEVSRVNDDFLRVSINCVQFDDNDLTLQPS